jgi:hypothetical protein
MHSLRDARLRAKPTFSPLTITSTSVALQCWTENGNFTRLVSEMAQGHNMIAEVEPVLWPARRPPAEIAILMPRSAEMWDLWELNNTAATGAEYMSGVTASMLAYAADYNAEVFGLFTALAVDQNVPVDIIDEDALLEPDVLKQYKVVVVTEPNVPAEGWAGVTKWAQAGGALVTVSGAGAFDEYGMVVGTPRPRWFLQGGAAPSAPAGGCKFGPHKNVTVCSMWNGTTAFGNFSAFGVRDTGDGTTSASVGPLPPPTTLAAFDDGHPAVTLQQMGRGSLVHFPWMPGVSYAYQRAIGGEAGLGGILANVSSQSGVCPPVIVSERRVETPLLLTPDGKSAVIALLNWRCTENWCTANDTAVAELSVRARLPFTAARISSATYGSVAATPCSPGPPADPGNCEPPSVHVVCFALPLKFGDLVTIQ